MIYMGYRTSPLRNNSASLCRPSSPPISAYILLPLQCLSHIARWTGDHRHFSQFFILVILWADVFDMAMTSTLATSEWPVHIIQGLVI